VVQVRIKSGRASVVVLEQTTESFTAFDFASNRTSITVRLNQLIAVGSKYSAVLFTTTFGSLTRDYSSLPAAVRRRFDFP